MVFDLDGTLVDSLQDIATALNRLRAELDLPPLSVEEALGMVGEGARKLVERALGDALPAAGQGREERLDAALAGYLREYWEVALATTRPYPGIAELLAALAPHYTLAVLSNKSRDLSLHVLAGLGLDEHLGLVLGGDSLPTRKPDPAGLLRIAEHLGVAPGALLMVGDSRIDAAAAANAGCRYARVDWGFPRPPAEADLPADLVLGHPRDLAAALL